jgi:hypothetical protein
MTHKIGMEYGMGLYTHGGSTNYKLDLLISSSFTFLLSIATFMLWTHIGGVIPQNETKYIMMGTWV